MRILVIAAAALAILGIASVVPPNAGDGFARAGDALATALVLLVFGFVLASVAGGSRRKL